jgi:hypothetical protein
MIREKQFMGIPPPAAIPMQDRPLKLVAATREILAPRRWVLIGNEVNMPWEQGADPSMDAEGRIVFSEDERMIAVINELSRPDGNPPELPLHVRAYGFTARGWKILAIWEHPNFLREMVGANPPPMPWLDSSHFLHKQVIWTEVTNPNLEARQSGIEVVLGRLNHVAYGHLRATVRTTAVGTVRFFNDLYAGNLRMFDAPPLYRVTVTEGEVLPSGLRQRSRRTYVEYAP